MSSCFVPASELVTELSLLRLSGMWDWKEGSCVQLRSDSQVLISNLLRKLFVQLLSENVFFFNFLKMLCITKKEKKSPVLLLMVFVTLWPWAVSQVLSAISSMKVTILPLIQLCHYLISEGRAKTGDPIKFEYGKATKGPCSQPTR